ncbi:hypothetical protein CLF_110665 [Clonorchis sinensis]|uniref:Endonuclease/exonuclease/phosphatase domain-containing protein n=1 Tax=Clonorchis sinensis TaxID=79923 RepID=G7YTQ7_CLOSI|nr:hypothetical protein CLF_110665 [Clonorchis sinensis]
MLERLHEQIMATIMRFAENNEKARNKIGKLPGFRFSVPKPAIQKQPVGATQSLQQAQPIVVIAPCAPESTPRQTTATPDSSFYSTTADPSNSIGSDALEEASLTWTERPKYVQLSALLSVTDVKGATENSAPKLQPSWIGSNERSQVVKPAGKPTTCADVDIGECCENRTSTEAVKLPISSSTPSKVASLIVDTTLAQDHDNQSHKPDHGEPNSPSYTQLATLIAGDSDDHTGAKERRLRPNKPYTTRQIRKLLAGFKVQSSEKTSLMGAPPKELPGAATQRSKQHRGTFPTKPRQNAQETKQTRDRPLSNSEPGRPEEVKERATSSNGRNFRPRGKKLRPPKLIGPRKPGSHRAKKTLQMKSNQRNHQSREQTIPLRGSDSLLLGVVYRSPSSPPEDDHFLIRTLGQLSSSYHFTHLLLVDDFNAPKAPWTELQCVGSSGPFTAALTEVTQQSAWTQHVVAPTRYRAGQQPSLLDLVITNERHFVDQVTINAPLGHSDHCVLTFDFICYWARNPEPQTWIRNFCRADFSGMRIFLNQVKLGPASVEDLYRTIVQKVHEADAISVPIKPACSWMSRKLPKRIRRLLESARAQGAITTIGLALSLGSAEMAPSGSFFRISSLELLWPGFRASRGRSSDRRLIVGFAFWTLTARPKTFCTADGEERRRRGGLYCRIGELDNLFRSQQTRARLYWSQLIPLSPDAPIIERSCSLDPRSRSVALLSRLNWYVLYKLRKEPTVIKKLAFFPLLLAEPGSIADLNRWVGVEASHQTRTVVVRGRRRNFRRHTEPPECCFYSVFTNVTELRLPNKHNIDVENHEHRTVKYVPGFRRDFAFVKIHSLTMMPSCPEHSHSVRMFLFGRLPSAEANLQNNKVVQRSAEVEEYRNMLQIPLRICLSHTTSTTATSNVDFQCQIAVKRYATLTWVDSGQLQSPGKPKLLLYPTVSVSKHPFAGQSAATETPVSKTLRAPWQLNIIEAPTLSCFTNRCTKNAAGDIQDPRKVEEFDEAVKLMVLPNKKQYAKHRLSIHAQSRMVRFGNVTNNLPENATGRLKDRVGHSDTLEQAILRITVTDGKSWRVKVTFLTWLDSVGMFTRFEAFQNVTAKAVL